MRKLLTKSLCIMTMVLFANDSFAQKPMGQNGPRDEKIPRKERPAFSQLDLNQDGVITLVEFKQHQIPHGDHETVFSHIDCDGDGIISEREHTRHKPPRHRRM